VITEAKKVIQNSIRMILECKAVAIDGSNINIKADTICLHGDTPGAVELAKAMKEEFDSAGIMISPMHNIVS
jgi:UPF0271 protein